MRILIRLCFIVFGAAGCETAAPSRFNSAQDIVSPACTSGGDAKSLRVADNKIKPLTSSEGKAILGFEVLNSGEVINTTICQSSGQPAVDNELISNLKQMRFASGQAGLYRLKTYR
ncbi:MAG: energy transducer TonB [Bdellovibrionales bacterium]|nr:energy transducer TonB [Bdellovibrionales bacterium]